MKVTTAFQLIELSSCHLRIGFKTVRTSIGCIACKDREESVVTRQLVVNIDVDADEWSRLEYLVVMLWKIVSRM